MDVVETAVGHDQDDVPGLGLPVQIVEDAVGVREKMGVPAQLPEVVHQFFR